MAEQVSEPMLVNTGSVDNPRPLSKAIIDGYAPDTELYTYAEFPNISSDELRHLQGANYPTIFYAITKKLIGSAIPDEVLHATAEAAYSTNNFDFDQDHNLQFTTLPSGIHIVGLSDGPTGAFKDMAMQPFARWMSYLLQQENSPLTILLSTTGDTGPAALNAFSDLPNIEIINMLPKSGVSRFQWSQMAELAGRDGVHVLEVAGHFSEINDMHMMADLEYDLGSVNSVNIARIIAQVPYYVASYLKAVELEDKQVGDPVDVSVPSGNFGNGLSAIIARKMGVPLRHIIIATNENNALDTLFKDGIYRKLEMQKTDSSAQDVNRPSNVWRYFAMLYGNDTEKIARTYNAWKDTGAVALHDVGIVDSSVMEGVMSATVTGEDRAYIIRELYATAKPAHSRLVDPHTANGLAAIAQLKAQELGVPMLAMETAQPFKFNETMSRIVGIVPPRPARFRGLEEAQSGKQLTQIANASELIAYLRDHTHAQSKN